MHLRDRAAAALVVLLACFVASCGSTPAAPDAAPAAAPTKTVAPDDPVEGGDPRAGAGPSEPEAPPAPPPPGQIDPRDQYTLGREIETARHLEPEQIDRRYGAIRRSWFNRRYRWEVQVALGFCREGYCPTLPFDHGRPGFDVGHGYMPILKTTAESHARIVAACAPHPACVIRFEGVLSRFDLSSVDATHLAFTEVNLLGARAARPNERWIRPVNVPRELVEMARDIGDAGTIRTRAPTTPSDLRLQALLERMRAASDGGAAARTPP